MPPLTYEDAESLRAAIAQHLAEIAREFVPAMKLTFLARLPGNDQATVFVSDDTAAEVVDALLALLSQPSALIIDHTADVDRPASPSHTDPNEGVF